MNFLQRLFNPIEVLQAEDRVADMTPVGDIARADTDTNTRNASNIFSLLQGSLQGGAQAPLPIPTRQSLVELYERDAMTAAIINKIHSLIMTDEDSEWKPNVEQFSASEQTEITDFFLKNLELFTEITRELLVTGSVIIEPYYPENDPFMVMYNVVPVKDDVEVVMAGSMPLYVKYKDKMNKGNAETTIESTMKTRRIINFGMVMPEEGNGNGSRTIDALPNDPGEDIKRRVEGLADQTYSGDVFYFRINNRINDRFGKAIHYRATESLRGYTEMRRSIVFRSRVARMASWVVKLSNKLVGDKNKSKKQRDAEKATKDQFTNALQKQDQVFFVREGEELMPVSPELRNLGMNDDLKTLKEDLFGQFELPTALFGSTDTTNRATLEGSKEGPVKTYTALQEVMIKHITMMVDHAITLKYMQVRPKMFSIIPTAVFSMREEDKRSDVTERLEILRQSQEDGTLSQAEAQALRRIELDRIFDGVIDNE